MAYYMQIEGVQGNVTAKGYNDGTWFEVSEGIGLSLTRTPSVGAQGAGDEVKMDEVSFSKKMDSASPFLFNLVTTGEKVKVKCNYVKTGEKMLNAWALYEFEKAMFTKYSPSGDTEQVSFSCEKVTFAYYPADVKGRLGSRLRVQWVPRQADD